MHNRDSIVQNGVSVMHINLKHSNSISCRLPMMDNEIRLSFFCSVCF